MMWNKAVEYDNSAGVDPNPPESWAASGNAYYYNNHFERYYKSWSPGSNSMFSKIYNAKVAIEKIVSDSNFSNLNFAFASFYQPWYALNGKTQENWCIYSADESFQNSADAPP